MGGQIKCYSYVNTSYLLKQVWYKAQVIENPVRIKLIIIAALHASMTSYWGEKISIITAWPKGMCFLLPGQAL